MDSDTGGIWDHAISGRKSVINWPAPASSSYSKRYSNYCYWLAEHIRLWTTSSVLLTRVAHQESKLLIWMRLSARFATTDAHHRPVRVHAQRPGKGLQAKQSESLRAQNSATQKLDQNRNNISQFIQSPLCTKPYSTSKLNIPQLWSQHLQSVSHDIPPISCRNIDR